MEEVLCALRNLPDDGKINWSHKARELGLTQKNGGQILKQIAVDHDLLRTDPDNEQTSTRRGKAKLSGGEISMPCLPTEEEITEEKKRMIDNGELLIGEPCTPFTISKVIINSDLSVETKEVIIHGRKIPLHELRQRLLNNQERYMRLIKTTDMSRNQLIERLQSLHIEYDSSSSIDSLREVLDKAQHKRTIAMWHDHSTILQTGYILFAVSVVYDLAVFLTEKEYKLKTGKSVDCIQTIIEEPEIYMIAPCTSYQLALISDRLECLTDLDTPCKTSNGTLISDTMRFFCGDKPAQQFERGNQVGGKYKGTHCRLSWFQALTTRGEVHHSSVLCGITVMKRSVRC